MKRLSVLALLVFLAYECAGQSVYIVKFGQQYGRLYTTKYVAPSGKLVRTEKKFEADSTIDFVDKIEKTVVLKTGCPVCGSEEARAVFAVAGLVGFQLAEVDRVWNCISCGTLYTGRRRK